MLSQQVLNGLVATDVSPPTCAPSSTSLLAPPEQAETVFTYAAPRLKFGPGSSGEIGYDLSRLAVRRALVVTDPGLSATGLPQRIAEQMARFGVQAEVYDRSRVEPTDQSLRQAIDWARANGPWDGFVAVGGGSSIDTAKAVDLMLTNPGDLMDYVNVPVGAGVVPTVPLKPLVAVPTTTGTGAESTAVCVMDVLALKVKTGISHAALRPVLAVVDPDLALSQPAGVTAASGMDVLCHALESYTARPYTSYQHKTPDTRVPYCGANPIGDMWAEKALSLMAESFRQAVHEGGDRTARTGMAMAATFAGMGFGNAGVHIPHANGYPIAGRVRDFHPRGYPPDEPMVPHGMSVALTAPAAFRFTFDACPDRHVRAARLLAPAADPPADLRDYLSAVLTDIMKAVDMPAGISAIGYGEGDIDDLVAGAARQQRLLATCPRPVTDDDLAAIFRASLVLW